MRYLVAVVIILVCAMLVLWREVETPVTELAPSQRARTSAPSSSRPTLSARPTTAPSAHETGPTSVTPPLGGMRAWSPSAAPSDGPDPFAPVQEIRTADDTRAGLSE